MKTAGDILSKLFDESFVKKAHTYSKLFDSWPDITEKNGISAASAHSRVKDLKKGILLIEMDHPAWKQLLQTKQSKLLNDFRIRFPDMGIVGISLMLGKFEPIEQTEEEAEPSDISTSPSGAESHKFDEMSSGFDETTASEIEAIKDDDLRQKLIKLGQTIAAREKEKNCF